MKQDVEVHKQDPVSVFKTQVMKNDREFRAALPAHIPVERFTRVVMTAVVNNPSLLEADRRSLFESSMKAAQDGLLPDGREGALVIYNTKTKGRDGGRDQWIKKVQWMPMIAGVLKKVRNSGELVSISAHVVYSNDEFSYELGDDERVTHRPALDNRGAPRLLYAIAKLKDGGVYREIMTVADVEKVRAISRVKDDGPWVAWWDEMARKTVLRRLSKRLPMSSDLDDLIRRDDHLYDFEGKQSHRLARTLAESPAERLKMDLDALADDGNGNGEIDPPHDTETGEVISDEMAAQAQAKTAEAIVNAVDQTSEALADPTGEKAGALLAQQLKERAAPPDLGTQRLLDDARAKTKEGAIKFKYWVARLNQKHFDQLSPYLDELRAEAEAGGL
jgi:recombination protein RecT